MTSLDAQDGDIAATVASILLEQKDRTDLSEREIASALGWGSNTVTRYLHGERVMPVDAFYRLSRLLGLDPKIVLVQAEQRIWGRSKIG